MGVPPALVALAFVYERVYDLVVVLCLAGMAAANRGIPGCGGVRGARSGHGNSAGEIPSPCTACRQLSGTAAHAAAGAPFGNLCSWFRAYDGLA